MANKNIIVEEVIYEFTGESRGFYGYFESAEQAVEWIRADSPYCETVKANVEYKFMDFDGSITWTIHDTKSEDFQQYCRTMRAGDLPCFNEDDMFVVD